VELRLTTLDGRLAVCRLGADEAVPPWATGGLVSVTRTVRELSIVCSADAVPAGVTAERDWRALEVAGPLGFELTGVIAALAGPLADRSVPAFAISTYDTDYLLVRGPTLPLARATLVAAGHIVDGDRG